MMAAVALLLSAGAAPVCTAQLSRETEDALAAFKVPDSPSPDAWKQLKHLVDRSAVCDDGALAGGFSELIVKMLGKQWAGALEFAPLRKESAFRRFVEQHIDETVNNDDVEIVRANAEKRCTVRAAKTFCRRIAKACAETLRSMLARVAPRCDEEMSNSTEAAIGDFKIPESTAEGDEAWKQYKLLVERYGMCNDGALGEMWDDLDIWMLGRQWEAAIRFAPLQQSDTLLRKFIEHFSGSTSKPDDVEIVRVKAASQCTVPAAAAFCRKLGKLTAWAPRSLAMTPERASEN